MLSKTSIHALRAMRALASLPDGEYAGAAAIAARIRAPRNYLSKLLKLLAREGLVDSQRGLGGGFRLARDRAVISLLEVANPIEHLDRWSGCILGNETCSADRPCPLHDRFKAVREAFLDLLGETTLADLAPQGDAEGGDGARREEKDEGQRTKGGRGARVSRKNRTDRSDRTDRTDPLGEAGENRGKGNDHETDGRFDE